MTIEEEKNLILEKLYELQGAKVEDNSLIEAAIQNKADFLELAKELQDEKFVKYHLFHGGKISALEITRRGKDHVEKLRQEKSENAANLKTEADLKAKILFLTSNPSNTSRLRIDKEAREIEEGLRRANKRNCFELAVRLATRPRDLSRAILDENPQILHFSGHGETEGLILEDENGISKVVTTIAIGGLFSLFGDTIKCVILNSCYSKTQAREISKYISFVIGMSKAVPDSTAIAFATSFYDAIGAGRDIEFAFKFGVSNIRLEGLKGSEIPVLLRRQIKPNSQ